MNYSYNFDTGFDQTDADDATAQVAVFAAAAAAGQQTQPFQYPRRHQQERHQQHHQQLFHHQYTKPRNQIFVTRDGKPIAFYLGFNEPNRAKYVTAIIENGGFITEGGVENVIYLTSHTKDMGGYVRTQFIDDCILAGTLLPSHNYVIPSVPEDLEPMIDVLGLEQHGHQMRHLYPQQQQQQQHFSHHQMLTQALVQPQLQEQHHQQQLQAKAAKPKKIAHNAAISSHRFTPEKDEYILDQVRKNARFRNSHEFFRELAGHEMLKTHTGNSIRSRYRRHLEPRLQFIYKTNQKGKLMKDPTTNQLIKIGLDELPQTLKNKFTPEDDYYLCQIVTNYNKSVAESKGLPFDPRKKTVPPYSFFNDMYRANHRHTLHSWRDRYRKYITEGTMVEYMEHYEKCRREGKEPRLLMRIPPHILEIEKEKEGEGEGEKEVGQKEATANSKQKENDNDNDNANANANSKDKDMVENEKEVVERDEDQTEANITNKVAIKEKRQKKPKQTKGKDKNAVDNDVEFFEAAEAEALAAIAASNARDAKAKEKAKHRETKNNQSHDEEIEDLQNDDDNNDDDQPVSKKRKQEVKLKLDDNSANASKSAAAKTNESNEIKQLQVAGDGEEDYDFGQDFDAALDEEIGELKDSEVGQVSRNTSFADRIEVPKLGDLGDFDFEEEGEEEGEDEDEDNDDEQVEQEKNQERPASTNKEQARDDSNKGDKDEHDPQDDEFSDALETTENFSAPADEALQPNNASSSQMHDAERILEATSQTQEFFTFPKSQPPTVPQEEDDEGGKKIEKEEDKENNDSQFDPDFAPPSQSQAPTQDQNQDQKLILTLTQNSAHAQDSQDGDIELKYLARNTLLCDVVKPDKFSKLLEHKNPQLVLTRKLTSTSSAGDSLEDIETVYTKLGQVGLCDNFISHVIYACSAETPVMLNYITAFVKQLLKNKQRAEGIKRGEGGEAEEIRKGLVNVYKYLPTGTELHGIWTDEFDSVLGTQQESDLFQYKSGVEIERRFKFLRDCEIVKMEMEMEMESDVLNEE